jgi:hypothetical protein
VTSITACDSIFGTKDRAIAGHDPLFTTHWVSDLDFGPDSRTVYYLEMDRSGRQFVAVRAIDAVTGARRTLVPSLVARNGMAQSIRAPGGSGVYVGLTQDVGCTPVILTRVPTSGGPTETLAPSIGAGMFAVSPAGGRIAFSTKAPIQPVVPFCRPGMDSVVIARVGTSTEWRLVERGVGGDDSQPVALSDAGTLVYLRATASGAVLRTVSPSGAVVRDIPLARDATTLSLMAFSRDVLWTGESPQLLVATRTLDTGGATISELDAATGARTDVATIPEVSFLVPWLARSADGRVWATWVAVKNLTPNAIERPVYRYQLMVGRQANSPQSVLTVDSDEGPIRLRIAPDGQRVAFVYRNGFYVIPIN